jgi:hypothetical protein
MQIIQLLLLLSQPGPNGGPSVLDTLISLIQKLISGLSPAQKEKALSKVTSVVARYIDA